VSDVSIIIAHREHDEAKASAYPLGLWMTLQSCMQDLEGSGIDYSFSIVTNGVERLHSDTTNVLHWTQEKAKKVEYLEHLPFVCPPPVARQTAIENSTGKILFLFDNHIMVKPGYFKRALESMEKYNMDMLHSTTRFFQGEKDCYHYKLRLAKNFWGEADDSPMFPEPYLIAVGGHGGCVIRRDAFDAVGGYQWGGWDGYGGEETYFDLKMWLLGRKVWLDPELLHYHYAGNRGYKRHYTDEFFINMMSVANIIGGEDWLYKVQDSFATNYMKMKSDKNMYDLMMIAQDKSAYHAEWLASKRECTLDELLEFFKQAKIAH
jgi:glycosyltransferase involved in cell wall biosynthesis